jgi:hypothetical protein
LNASPPRAIRTAQPSPRARALAAELRRRYLADTAQRIWRHARQLQSAANRGDRNGIAVRLRQVSLIVAQIVETLDAEPPA